MLVHRREIDVPQTLPKVMIPSGIVCRVVLCLVGTKGRVKYKPPATERAPNFRKKGDSAMLEDLPLEAAHLIT